MFRRLRRDQDFHVVSYDPRDDVTGGADLAKPPGTTAIVGDHFRNVKKPAPEVPGPRRIHR